MKPGHNFGAHFIFTTLLLLSVFACQKKIDFTDQTLGWKGKNIENYISEYSPLRISASDAIMIRFSRIPDQEVSDNENNVMPGIADIHPVVEGKWIWKDAVTLVFEPAVSLGSGKLYEVELNLDKIFKNVPKDEKKATLLLATYHQKLTISHEGLEYYTDEQGNSAIQVKGWINSLDDSDPKEIEKAISLFQESNKKLSIKWEHTTPREHIFYITGIQRTEKESELEIIYDGADTDKDFKGTINLRVAGLNDFVFLESKIEKNGTKTIDLIFSDPLSNSAENENIVTIDEWNEKIPADINGNRITLYLDQYKGDNLTLHISPELKNKKGKVLGQGITEKISFAPIPPQVKAMRKGVIMPETEQIWFPFQAVNLKSVQIEISKIYQNNVLQFLQYNALDQHYDLTPVAKKIYSGKIDLSTISPASNEDKWQKYTLDLSKMINVDPGAIYNVDIRFSREDVLRLDCETKENAATYGSGAYQEITYDNQNPCNAYYYYYGDHFVRNNIFSSNIGLMAKGSRKNKSWTVFANDLLSAAALRGTEIILYDFQKQEVGRGSTDGNGVATVLCKDDPSFVMAKKDGSYGYLSLLDYYSNQLSEFDITGKQLKDGLDVFIYGERGVYRPGDTMFVSAMLFQHPTGNDQALHNMLPVKIQVEDSRGKLQFEKTLVENHDHIYHCKIPTSENAPTGNWKWVVTAGGEKFYKTIKVETIKPNRLKIKYKEDIKSVKLYANPFFRFSSSWLHGAAAEGLKSEVEVNWTDREQKFTQYKEYKFSDPARTSSYNPTTVFSGNVDQTGSAEYSIPQNPDFRPASGLKMGIKTRVYERSGNFSEDYFSADAHVYNSYVGIKIPESEWGGNYFKSGTNQSIGLVLVDPDGRPLSNRELSVGLYSAEWNWWYNESNYNLLKFNSAEHTGALKTSTVKTNSRGEAIFSDIYEDNGNYLIRVCDNVSGHCTGGLFYTSKWGNPPVHGEGAQIIKLKSAKESYKTGEIIKLRIPSSKNSKILLSIEQGDRLIDTRAANGEEGETTVDIPVTEKMSPNVYLHVSLINPYELTKNGLPYRMYGVLPVKITNPDKELHPVIETPAVLRPDEPFTVKVAEKQSKPMSYTIAVVDEGLLDLTRFKTPNPYDHFFAKMSLGVATWDLYDKVMHPFGQEFENLFSVGGDADALNLNSVKKANRFIPTVKFLGPFTSNGKAQSHTIKIDNYVGSVRIMVVAKSDNSFGNAEVSRPVKKDLMVQTTIPRILAPGDQFRLGANIFAMAKQLGNINVQVEADKNFAVKGSDKSVISFAKEEDVLASFDIKTGNTSGIGRIGAIAGNGRMSAKDINEIEIRNPNAPETRVREFKVEAGKKIALPIELFGSRGSHAVQLEISNMLPVNLHSRLQYLVQYPYGCIEQITSAAFPQLYVTEIMHLSPKNQKEITTNITKAIQKIGAYQTTGGGFSYWPGNNNTEDWATTYAGHFLTEAKAQNYYVPEKLITSWYNYQRSTANKYNTAAGGDHTAQAYRLYSLAKYGKPEHGAMNRLRQAKDLTSSASSLLAAAFAISGKTQVAKELLNIVSKKTAGRENANYVNYTYASPLRDEALRAEALMLSGQTNAAYTAIKGIIKQLNNDSWYNTQAISHALLVVEKFYKNADKNGLIASLQYNGKSLEKINTSKSIAMVDIPLQESIKGQSITFTNETKGPVYIKTIVKGTPSIDQGSTASSKNLQVRLAYQNERGAPLNVAELAQGQNFTAKITVINPGTYAGNIDNIALTFQVPAGWEIINNRLNDWTAQSSGFDHQDIRDDRVITFLDVSKGKPVTVEIALTATYAGEFYHAGITAEAMYNHDVSAGTASSRVKVISTNAAAKKEEQ